MAAKRCTNFIASLSLNLANKAKDNQKKNKPEQSQALPPFTPEELNFLREAYQHRQDTQGRQFSVNIGSWWPYAFGSTRTALAGTKKCAKLDVADGLWRAIDHFRARASGSS